MQAVSARHGGRSNVERDWSHAALHAPLWGVDLLHPAIVDDVERLRKYPFSLALPYDNLDVDDDPSDPSEKGCRPIGRLTGEGLAGWIYGGDGRVRWRALGRAERLVSEIAAHDWLLADAERIERAIHAGVARNGGPALRKKNQAAEQLGLAIREELRAVLADGLERRASQRLRPFQERDTFFQLAARVAISSRKNHWTYVDGWQVCDRCDVVFPARQQNARWCVKCRRSRPPKVHPLRDGGWHIGTHGDPTDGTLIYFVQCECGRLFSDPRARQRLCGSCREGADRVRRLRLRQRAASD